MPSTKKSLYFLSSALVTAISVGVLGYGMSTEWATTTMKCARKELGIFNGTAVITLKLFDGVLKRFSCPTFDNTDAFQVIPMLKKIGGSSVVLHGLVVCLLALCLLFSAVSILICLYNSVSNPYQTYMGPIGIYTCSSLSACLSVVVLIIFVVNVNVTIVAEDLIKNFSGNIAMDLKDQASEMLVGYYLVIPYMVLSLCAIALIYVYDHAAYTHRREQERPTEDAPKEIMMY
uniref:Clarin 3 n=1 Tax=Monopterus albus TaxID=43700 RepID=A0A3Q3IIM1_MONAL|nr:clarin-3 [Monopterus albus]